MGVEFENVLFVLCVLFKIATRGVAHSKGYVRMADTFSHISGVSENNNSLSSLCSRRESKIF